MRFRDFGVGVSIASFLECLVRGGEGPDGPPWLRLWCPWRPRGLRDFRLRIESSASVFGPEQLAYVPTEPLMILVANIYKY